MENAFETLKNDMLKEVELAFPDYELNAEKLNLWVDASAVGAGACLTQVQNGEVRTIAHSSMTFSGAQRRYSVTDRELAAIRWGVKTFRGFLYGVPFVVNTDHQALQYLHNMKIVNNRLARTFEDLADFNFELRYTPGKENLAADALSRESSHRLQLPGEPSYGVLPEGLMVTFKPEGGGDSLVECLYFGLEKFRIDGPANTLELRRQLIEILMRSPAKYKLKLGATNNQFLKLALCRGQPMMPEVIQAYCDQFCLDVLVYFGGDRPLVYKAAVPSGDTSRKVLHLVSRRYSLQCSN
jgi:hypothetical protein